MNKQRNCPDCNVDITGSHYARIRCKVCSTKRTKELAYQKRDKYNAQKREYRKKHLEAHRAREKAWNENNQHKRKEYRRKNKEKLAEKDKKWREKNQEHLKQYYLDNKEMWKKNGGKWRDNNKDKCANYYLDNKEKRDQQTRDWLDRDNNRERMNKRVTDRLRKARAELDDLYMKSLLTDKRKNLSVKSSDITPELIELKRQIVILHRIVENER